MTTRAIPVTLIGRAAATAFRADSVWEVCAVFRRSFYCRSRSGSLACLGASSLGAGPLNAICAPPDRSVWDGDVVSLGDSARCEGTAFRVTGRIDFSLAEAAVWRPPCPAAPWRLETLAEGLGALAAVAHAWPRRDGLQELIPGLAAPGGGAVWPETPLARLALAGIRPLGGWLEASLSMPREAAPSPFPQSEILIGLGPGLTPSGDDFLGGVLVALHVMGFPIQAGRLAAEVLPRAELRTHAISRAHLAAAASGEGSAALHAVLVALLTPGAPGLSMRLQVLDAIGHTSGWDALAGAALALAAATRRSV